MNNLTELIRRHQLIAYFVLTYAFSWALWVPLQPLVLDGHSYLMPLISLGVFAPALVIHGGEDLTPIESSREWVKALPLARLLTIQVAGHIPHLEAPEVFFPAVREFLDGEWPEGAEELA